MTQPHPALDLLCIVGIVALVAAVIWIGGWLIDRKNSLLSGPDPVDPCEHFEGEPR